ncbi:MAG: DUF4062 domain-containing protein [Bryobacteraceae bacterium]
MAIPTVFISSTAEDLKDYREVARDGAISAGFHPQMMEYSVASGKKPPLKKCLDDVAGSNVLVVIAAHRYGWVPPDQAAGECRSITWLECLEAERCGKEILAFLIDKNHQWPTELREAYRIMEAVQKGEKADLELLQEVQRNTAQLEEFKSWLNSRGTRAAFTTREDLRGKVESALREWKGDSGGSGDPGRYLAYLREQIGWIDIRGLNVGSGKVNRFPIEDLYIPLTTAGSLEDGNTRRRERPNESSFCSMRHWPRHGS